MKKLRHRHPMYIKIWNYGRFLQLFWQIVLCFVCSAQLW